MTRRDLYLAGALLGSLTLAGCPKPQPSPVPADECKKSGQACAGKPAPEAPPPIGSNTPPKS